MNYVTRKEAQSLQDFRAVLIEAGVVVQRGEWKELYRALATELLRAILAPL